MINKDISLILLFESSNLELFDKKGSYIIFVVLSLRNEGIKMISNFGSI